MKTLLLIALLFSFNSEANKISNIIVTQTTGQVINLTTNIPSFATVKYSSNCSNLNLIATDVKRSTSHRIVINGLKFGTKYCYRIIAKDINGKSVATKKEFFITKKFIK